MPVQEGRIAKRLSALTTPTHRKRPAPRTGKPLPLVERTNKLTLDEFVLNYAPSCLDPSSSSSIQDAKSQGPSGNSNGNRTIEIHTSTTLPPSDFETCFKLIESTSAMTYTASTTGWSPQKKKKEMKLPEMKYLLLRGGDGGDGGQKQGVLGFLSFMVTYEDGKEVLYCYEIHLDSTARGCGLGKELMGRFEDIGRHIGLEKAMLTVFRSNEKALGFYGKLGYVVDEFSPGPRMLRNGTVKEVDYLILSKSLRTETG